MGIFRALGRGVRWVNWPLVASLLAGLSASAAALAAVPHIGAWLFETSGLAVTPARLVGVLAVGVMLAMFGAWSRAASEGRLTAASLFAGDEDRRRPHISGGGVVLSLLLVGGIVTLVSWATRAAETPPITENWGLFVVYGLAILFLGAALVPLSAVVRPLGAIARPIDVIFRPIGVLASLMDSILVFAVAGAAGAAERRMWVRFLVLAPLIGSAAMLTYLLPPPWSFVPLAWASLVVIAIARRWTWIEDDRELYMLTRAWVSSQQRIGFQHDLRAEALVCFGALMFLVPLALREAHLLTMDAATGAGVFVVAPDAAQHFDVWLAFYGTELAKAVPFVDWAEIYQVEGASQVSAESDMARHLVFATRALVDLVLLAALVQAFTIAARNARQLDLFREGHLPRLDPFLEPQEFRRLLVKDAAGDWVVEAKAAARFPTYDPVRLVELSREVHAPIDKVAQALRRLQLANVGGDFYDRLLEIANSGSPTHGPNREALTEVLAAIRDSQAPLLAIELEFVRMALNGRRPFIDLRGQIVGMMAAAPSSLERTRALASAGAGLVRFAMPEDPETYGRGDPPPPAQVRDSVQEVRRIAIDALVADLSARDPLVLEALRTVAADDPAGALRTRAARALEAAGETVPT